MSNNFDSFYNETVQILERLGHFVYVEDEHIIPPFIQDFIDKHHSQSAGACLHLMPNDYCVIYLRDKSFIWHETWHVLQRVYDPHKLKYWYIKNEFGKGFCPSLSYIEMGMDRYEWAGCVGDESVEIPAYAVQNDPKTVLKELYYILSC